MTVCSTTTSTTTSSTGGVSSSGTGSGSSGGTEEQRDDGSDESHSDERMQQSLTILLSPTDTDTDTITVSHPLIDAHNHCQLHPLYSRAYTAISQAIDRGIQAFSICGTAPGIDWERVEELANSFPRHVKPSFGLHPWYIDSSVLHSDTGKSISMTLSYCITLSVGNSWYSQLEDYLCRIPHAGVGECGIDKNVLKKQQQSLSQSPSYTGVPPITMEDQIDILKRHIDLAVKYQRVLTLHCVSGCWGQLLQIFQSLEGKIEGKRKRKGEIDTVQGSDR